MGPWQGVDRQAGLKITCDMKVERMVQEVGDEQSWIWPLLAFAYLIDFPKGAYIFTVSVLLIDLCYGTIFPIVFLLKRVTFCRTNILPHTACEHTGLSKYACNGLQVNIWYGFFVLMSTVTLDVVLIFISYMLILHAIFRLPSQDARHKALNTCGSHVCVIILFYGPGIFSTLTNQFGHQISADIHVLLANVCILAPPMLNPIIYGVKTKQIRDQVTHVLFLKVI
ncbi:olfactory receptor 52B4-like [Peromyscus leucopus]|uniref:olfactory receptor 52B4-like n=1 Tax=Peromyscus leucopus TaxID=10041 RepID=UPI0010A17A39|nr:olfactory receptor 52B4-like [Peromyscus leucopus]